jgi:hypothetical protein
VWRGILLPDEPLVFKFRCNYSPPCPALVEGIENIKAAAISATAFIALNSLTKLPA